MPIPLYGFLKGDTMGLVVIGHEEETVLELAAKLQLAASTRVDTAPNVKVFYKGRQLEPSATLSEAGLEPLERFDVVQEGDQ